MKSFLRYLMIALLAFAAPALTACEGIRVSPPPGPVVSLPGTADDQAYARALNAYDTAQKAYLAANRRGQVPADLKPKARAADKTAVALLNALDTLRNAGNSTTFNAQLTLAMKAIADFQALIPRS